VGGADRVELCVGLELGGLTPSQGLIEAAALGELPTHVLIRPRPGDFVFDADDLDLMERETRAAVDSGAAGVVIGALTSDGSLDAVAVERLVEAARSTGTGASVTFHRAIDQSADPVALVASLASLGVDRVLTSGAASRAIDGGATLARVVEASGAVEVMAGGGVSPVDIPALVALGVDAVHLSAKRPAARRGGGWVSLGAAADAPDTYFETDAAVVRAARAAVDAAAAR
jgi:copper homeostasis protein